MAHAHPRRACSGPPSSLRSAQAWQTAGGSAPHAAREKTVDSRPCQTACAAGCQLGRPGSQRGGVASVRRPIYSVHVMCSEGSRLSGAKARLIMMNFVGWQAARRPRGSLVCAHGAGVRVVERRSVWNGHARGPFICPKSPQTGPIPDHPVFPTPGWAQHGWVPRALRGPLLQPAAATCFEHHPSSTIAPEAPAIRSPVCGAACFRLSSAEIMGGARAHLRCQCQNMLSTPYHDGRPRPPPAPACCIWLHDTPNRRNRQIDCFAPCFHAFG